MQGNIHAIATPALYHFRLSRYHFNMHKTSSIKTWFTQFGVSPVWDKLEHRLDLNLKFKYRMQMILRHSPTTVSD